MRRDLAPLLCALGCMALVLLLLVWFCRVTDPADQAPASPSSPNPTEAPDV